MLPVPHTEMISLLKGADAALLFGQSGSGSLASVPGKAYDYIGVGKPVLAIGAGDEVCELLNKGGCSVWSTSADDPAQIAAAIKDMAKYLNGADPREAVFNSARSQFTRNRMALRLEGVLLQAIADH